VLGWDLISWGSWAGQMPMAGKSDVSPMAGKSEPSVDIIYEKEQCPIDMHRGISSMCRKVVILLPKVRAAYLFGDPVEF